MLLLGDDTKEWMEEDCQAEKENIPSSKRMKSNHSKIQFGTKVSTDEEIVRGLFRQTLQQVHAGQLETLTLGGSGEMK